MNNKIVRFVCKIIATTLLCSQFFLSVQAKNISLNTEIKAKIYENSCVVLSDGKSDLTVSFDTVDVRDVINQVQDKIVKKINLQLNCSGPAGRGKSLKVYTSPGLGSFSSLGINVMKTDKAGLGIALYKGESINSAYLLPLNSWTSFWGAVDSSTAKPSSQFQITAALIADRTRLVPGEFSATMNLLLSYQ